MPVVCLATGGLTTGLTFMALGAARIILERYLVSHLSCENAVESQSNKTLVV
jgi:hypothetical protein